MKLKLIPMFVLGIFLIVSCRVVNTTPPPSEDEPAIPKIIVPPYTIELHSDEPVELVLSYGGKVRRYEVYGDFKLEVHEVVRETKVDWRFGDRSGVTTVEGNEMEFERAFMGKTGKVVSFGDGKMVVLDPFDPFWRVEIGNDLVPDEVEFYPVSSSDEVAVLKFGNHFKIFQLGEEAELLSSGQFPMWFEHDALNPYISKFFVLESGSTKPDSIDLKVESELFDESYPTLGDEKSERSRIFTSEGNVYTFINTSAGLSIYKYREDEFVKSVDVYSVRVISSPLPVGGYLVIPVRKGDGVTIACLSRRNLKYKVSDQILSEPEDIRLVSDESGMFALFLYDVVLKSFLVDPISCSYEETHEYYHPPSEIHGVLTDGEDTYLLTSFGRKIEILKPDLSKVLELELDDDVRSISVHEGALLVNGEKLIYIPELAKFWEFPSCPKLETESIPSLINVEAYHDYSEEILRFRVDYEDGNEDDVFVRLEMKVRKNWIASDYSTEVVNATELVIDVSGFDYVDEATICVEDSLGLGSCENMKNIW